MGHVGSGEGAVTLKSWIFTHVYLNGVEPRFASFAFALSMVVLFWGVAAVMERKGWYWRL